MLLNVEDGNCGSAGALSLDAATSKILIEFDLGSIEFTNSTYNVASVSLRLFVNIVDDTRSIAIYKLPHSVEWDEEQVDWDNFGIISMAEAGPVVFLVNSFDEGGWVDIDIKDLIDGSQGTLVLVMILSASVDTGTCEFASSETCHSPKLVVVTESI